MRPLTGAAACERVGSVGVGGGRGILGAGRQAGVRWWGGGWMGHLTYGGLGFVGFVQGVPGMGDVGWKCGIVRGASVRRRVPPQGEL